MLVVSVFPLILPFNDKSVGVTIEPPTYKLPPIPTPPPTISAPVVELTEANVFPIVTIPLALIESLFVPNRIFVPVVLLYDEFKKRTFEFENKLPLLVVSVFPLILPFNDKSVGVTNEPPI